MVRVGEERTPFRESSGEEIDQSPEPVGIERNQEPVDMPPIPPYEYPSPAARSSPGDTPNVRKTRTVGPEQPGANVPTPEPPARRPKPFIERPRQRVSMSHPETVTLPPIQEVIRQPKPSKIFTPEPSKTIPKTIRKMPEKQFGNNSPNNSETIHQPNSLEPDKQAPEASGGGYKKKGKVGRQRKYEEPGNNGEIPVKKVVLFRHVKGRHWPGMSQDMQEWYNRYYFTKPKKTGKAEDHARHVRSYERGQRWIAEHEGRQYQPGTGALGHSGKIVAYRKRATS